MRRNMVVAGIAACALVASAPAAAQSSGAATGGLGGLAGLGGGGLLGGALGGASVGNAAGLLSYCVKNKLLGGANATSALGKLLGRDDVTSSEGFAAGKSGQVQTGAGQGLSLDSVKGKLKSKMCGMVLQHARSFL